MFSYVKTLFKSILCIKYCRILFLVCALFLLFFFGNYPQTFAKEYATYSGFTDKTFLTPNIIVKGSPYYSMTTEDNLSGSRFVLVSDIEGPKLAVTSTEKGYAQDIVTFGVGGAGGSPVNKITVQDINGQIVEVLLDSDRNIVSLASSNGKILATNEQTTFGNATSHVNFDSTDGKKLMDQAGILFNYKGNIYTEARNQELIYFLENEGKGFINNNSALTPEQKAADLALLDRQIRFLRGEAGAQPLTSAEANRLIKDGGTHPDTSWSDLLGGNLPDTINRPNFNLVPVAPGSRDGGTTIGTQGLVDLQVGANIENTDRGDEEVNTGLCIIWDTKFLQTDSGANLVNCLSQLFYFLLWLVSYIVGFVGMIFNAVFNYTVRNIKSTIDTIPVIHVGWKIMRDLANITFIFILLYLAIATILQLDEHGVKHSLSRLIIAAVLINFSLLFTKVVIDIPNMLAVTIYDKITIVGQNPDGTSKFEGGDKGLGDAFMTIFAPAAVVNDNSISQRTLAGEGGDVTPTGNNAQIFAASASPFTTFSMGIILNFFIIIVFLAVIIIFIKRFVMLIFLMIFSPLAFAGMAMPIHSLQSMANDKFWSTLIKESFYAPIFMICAYLTLIMGQSITAKDFLDKAHLQDYGTLNIGIILGFAVTIVMLIASLFIAEMMGVQGASGAMNFTKGATAKALGAARWVGGNTVGRASNAIVRSTIGQLSYNLLEGKGGEGSFSHNLVMWRTKAKSGALGGAARLASGALETVLHKGVNLKVAETGQHFEEEIEEKISGIGQHLYEIKDNPQATAQFMHELSRRGKEKNDLASRVALERSWEDKDVKQQAEVIAAMEDLAEKSSPEQRIHIQKSIDHLRNRLDATEQEELKEKMEGPLKFHRTQMDELLTQKNTYKNFEAHTENHQAYQDFKSNKIDKIKGKDTAGNEVLLSGAAAEVYMKQQKWDKPEPEITVVDDHGHKETLSGAKAKKHMEDHKWNESGEKAKELFKKFGTEQRVGLRPEQFVDDTFSGLLTSEDLEQFQRKARSNADVKKKIAAELKQTLEEFMKKDASMITKEELDRIDKIAQYVDGNGKRWFGSGELGKPAIAHVEKLRPKVEGKGTAKKQRDYVGLGGLKDYKRPKEETENEEEKPETPPENKPEEEDSSII